METSVRGAWEAQQPVREKRFSEKQAFSLLVVSASLTLRGPGFNSSPSRDFSSVLKSWGDNCCGYFPVSSGEVGGGWRAVWVNRRGKVPTCRAQRKLLTWRSEQQGQQQQHGVRRAEISPARTSRRQPLIPFLWDVRGRPSPVAASTNLGCGRGAETEGFHLQVVAFRPLC